MKIPVVWSDEIGLEEVEDKSAGYKPVSKKAKGSIKASNKKSSNKNDIKKATNKKDSSLSYDKLAKMSPEERMEYYKKAFGSKEQGKKKNIVTPMPKVQSAPSQKTTKPKKGLLSKVLSFFRRDK